MAVAVIMTAVASSNVLVIAMIATRPIIELRLCILLVNYIVRVSSSPDYVHVIICNNNKHCETLKTESE